MLEFEFVDEIDKKTPSRRTIAEKIEIPTEFAFELIDESDLEFAERGAKVKKTPCLLDECKLENRTYWGNPPTEYDNDGYILLVVLVESRIYRSVQKYLVIELDEIPEYRLLKKEDRDYFAKLQNELLHQKQKEWLEQNKG